VAAVKDFDRKIPMRLISIEESITLGTDLRC
jgi:hypothetical protein